MRMQLLPNQNSNLSELEPFAKVNHIVTDLDGTLMHDFGTVWKRIRPAITFLRSKKVSFSIATGRSLNGVKSVLEKIQLPIGTPIILYNGTVVLKYNNGEVIYDATIPDDVLKKIIDLAKVYPISAYASKLDRDIYFQLGGKITSECERVYGWGIPYRDFDFNGLHVLWNVTEVHEIPNILWNVTEVRELPTTIVIECHDKRIEHIIMTLLEAIDGINVTTSGTGFIEIVPSGCNKGAALEIIRQKFTWPLGSVLCIGDNDNDVSLLKSADIGIAVGNASSSVKAVADYICSNCNIKGVLDVFDAIKDSKRYFEHSV